MNILKRLRCAMMVGLLCGTGLLLAGCAAQTRMTSDPTGAEVAMNGNHIGRTPFMAVIPDEFGHDSVYRFTATKKGYRPASMSFFESGLDDAAHAIPREIHFDLEPEDPK